MNEPRELPHVEVLRVQPGDVIVYQTTAVALTDEQFDELMGQHEALFPNNRGIVLEPGMTLAVARKEDAA